MILLLLAGAAVWIGLLAFICCLLAASGRADREAERWRPPARAPERPPLRLLPGGAQGSVVSSSGNRTAVASRSSRRPL
jgi:hypothetical protein